VARKQRRSFTQAFKQSAVARMATTASIRGLAAELNVEQRLLYLMPRQQAGHMIAIDPPVKFLNLLLRPRGRPHMNADTARCVSRGTTIL
jgi:transposase-like protein